MGHISFHQESLQSGDWLLIFPLDPGGTGPFGAWDWTGPLCWQGGVPWPQKAWALLFFLLFSVSLQWFTPPPHLEWSTSCRRFLQDPHLWDIPGPCGQGSAPKGGLKSRLLPLASLAFLCGIIVSCWRVHYSDEIQDDFRAPGLNCSCMWGPVYWLWVPTTTSPKVCGIQGWQGPLWVWFTLCVSLPEASRAVTSPHHQAVWGSILTASVQSQHALQSTSSLFSDQCGDVLLSLVCLKLCHVRDIPCEDGTMLFTPPTGFCLLYLLVVEVTGAVDIERNYITGMLWLQRHYEGMCSALLLHCSIVYSKFNRTRKQSGVHMSLHTRCPCGPINAA